MVPRVNVKPSRQIVADRIAANGTSAEFGDGEQVRIAAGTDDASQHPIQMLDERALENR